ncbi:DUF5906 domain-containing protein, partial [Crocosphaera sp. Alani8]|uniref:DUF5906 domain-containing protein n=1 Tax=Crocosphaera sp. Alani8 TaxID=3038952 RepID=UPI00313E8B46
GGSGKSTLTQLAIALVGIENVFITDLEILEKDKFETANIKDKLLVILQEAVSYKGVKKLKALTGGDRLRFEQKFKQALESFYPNAMVMITSNEPIKTGDYTSGLYRREIPLSMTKRIPDKEQRKLIGHDQENNLVGEFAPFIPGLLNWVLEMNPDEATKIIKDPFTHAPGLLKSKLENLIDTNSIAGWLNEKVVYIDGYETQVGCKSPLSESKEHIWLYANYCDYCSLTGVNAVSLTRFSYLLLDLCKNQLGFSIRKGRNTKGAFIEGLKIRDHLDEEKLPLIEGLYTPLDYRGDEIDGFMTESMTAETSTNDESDGYDGFSSSSEKNQSTAVALLEKPSRVVEPPKEKIEETENNPSQSSSSTSVTVSEEKQAPITHHKIVGRDELIGRIDVEMERLGWTTAIGKDYLVNQYGVSSRQRLTDDQLLEFYQNLKGASLTAKETPKYEIGQFLQGFVPHPMGMVKVEGTVVEQNGDRWLKDESGITYPLTVMEEVKRIKN